MAKFDHRNFHDRAANSVAAKQALLAKFANRPKEDDPDVVRRKAERETVIRAREIRNSHKEAARVAGEAAEAAAREEAALMAELAKIVAEEDRIERDINQEVERKAARDARYAARKARKGRK